MRSSRPNRRERRASQFSRNSSTSSVQLASGMLALGALASAFQSDSAMAQVGTSTPNSPRSTQNNVAPRVTILQPSYADLIKGTTQIVIAVETKGAPTKNVEMFIDGVSATGGAASLAGLNSAQFDWKTTTVKDGLRRLTVRVTDENGLRGEAETQVYINNSRTADTKAPTLNWQNVRDGNLLHGETKLQLSANDNFGVKYIVITVNPVDQPDRKPPLRASLINRAPFEYSLDTTRLPDGVYVLNARAYDMLDNEGSTQNVTFGVTNNGLNPTVIERLNEVLAAQNPAPSSTRSSPIATNARPKLQPNQNARTAQPKTVKPQTSPKVVAPKVVAPKVVAPKVVAPKVVAPKVIAQKSQTAKPVASPVVKSAPVRVAAAAIKAPIVASNVTPSIAVSRPVIERPALTQATNMQALSGAAVIKNAPQAFDVATAFEAKIGSVDAKPRLAVVPKTQPKTAQNSSVSTIVATNETSAPTVAQSGTTVDVFASNVALQDSSATASRDEVSRNEMVTQRAQTPQTPTRMAKLPETRAIKTTQSEAFAPSTTSQNAEVQNVLAASQVVAEPSQKIEYSMSPRASVPKTAVRETSRSFATPVRIVVEPKIEKSAVRIAELPKSRAPQAISSATIAPTVATANVIKSRVAVSESKNVVPQRARTPQRLAALPTRRDNSTASEVFSTPLAAKVRDNAAITVSPITIAAMQTRGSQNVVPASYIVKKGETLSALALRYGLRAETLASVNGLKTTETLNVGQKLSLPRALKVSYRGQDVAGDAQAVQIGDVSAAPFRFLFEQQGGKMTWDAATQRVTASNGSHHVSITIGSREASVGDQKVMMDLAAFLLSGRTMVPVRFFEKAFDTKVEWEPATSRIYVAMSNDSVLNR